MKKSSKQWLIIAALGFASMGSVWADGGHWHGGHDHSHIGIGIGSADFLAISVYLLSVDIV